MSVAVSREHSIQPFMYLFFFQITEWINQPKSCKVVIVSIPRVGSMTLPTSALQCSVIILLWDFIALLSLFSSSYTLLLLFSGRGSAAASFIVTFLNKSTLLLFGRGGLSLAIILLLTTFLHYPLTTLSLLKMALVLGIECFVGFTAKNTILDISFISAFNTNRDLNLNWIKFTIAAFL